MGHYLSVEIANCKGDHLKKSSSESQTVTNASGPGRPVASPIVDSTNFDKLDRTLPIGCNTDPCRSDTVSFSATSVGASSVTSAIEFPSRKRVALRAEFR